MDTIYDLGRLNQDELFELRAIQRKMQDERSALPWPRQVGGSEELARLTLEELKRLEWLYYKMAGEPCPCAHEFEQTAPYEHERATWHVEILPCYSRDYPGYKIRDSGVTAAPSQPVASNPPAVAPKPAQPAEPVAIAPSPAPVKPVAPATAPPAVKPVRPAEDVLSAARQLDSVLRFGYDLPEEPR